MKEKVIFDIIEEPDGVWRTGFFTETYEASVQLYLTLAIAQKSLLEQIETNQKDQIINNGGR